MILGHPMSWSHAHTYMHAPCTYTAIHPASWTHACIPSHTINTVATKTRSHAMGPHALPCALLDLTPPHCPLHNGSYRDGAYTLKPTKPLLLLLLTSWAIPEPRTYAHVPGQTGIWTSKMRLVHMTTGSIPLTSPK